jgi:hypothetical protein
VYLASVWEYGMGAVMRSPSGSPISHPETFAAGLKRLERHRFDDLAVAAGRLREGRRHSAKRLAKFGAARGRAGCLSVAFATASAAFLASSAACSACFCASDFPHADIATITAQPISSLRIIEYPRDIESHSDRATGTCLAVVRLRAATPF